MEERIYDIRVKEGEKACDTDKCMLKQDGTIAYMNHNGHWNHDTLIGCLIKLSIGTYRYMAKEKINKKWNMTISNGLITITGDRQMLRSRKKMNDKYIVTKVKEAIDKIKNTVVEKINNLKKLLDKRQLCLPQPKDLLEQLIDELNYFMKEDFLKRPEIIAENEKMFKKFKEYEYELIPNDLNDKSKIYNILYTASLRGDEGKIYKKLLSYLHPDHCTKVNASELTQYLVKVYKVNFKK